MSRRVREILGYLLLAVVATWPLLPCIATHAPGAELWQGRPIFPESRVHLWNLWWFRHSLVELGQSPFRTTYIFYPVGANLWFHTGSAFLGTVALVLQYFVGLVASFNILVLASFVAAGAATSALARQLGLGAQPAFLAGCVFAFAAATMRHVYVGHLELIWTAWLPLALWAFLRAVDFTGRRAWLAAAILGIVVGGTALSAAYYAVYAIELLVVVSLVRWRTICQPAVLARLALAAVVAGAIVLPMMLAYLGPERPTTQPSVLAHDFRTHSLEPLGWIVPSFTNPIAAASLAPIQFMLSRGNALPQETTGAVAFTVVSLVALGLLRRRALSNALQPGTVRIGLVVALVFAILSLGSELKLLGRPMGVPLPMALLQDVPVLQQARAPGRHIIVAMIGLSLLAGVGWQAIRDRRWKVVAAAALAVELLPAPLPLLDMSVPPAYARVAREPGEFAVLDVPLGMRDGMRMLGQPDSRQMLAQTVHHRPIFGGVVSRQTDVYWDTISSAPLIGTLLNPAQPTASRAETRQYFDEWRINAIVMNPNASADERRLIESSLDIARRDSLPDGWEIWWRK